MTCLVCVWWLVCDWQTVARGNNHPASSGGVAPPDLINVTKSHIFTGQDDVFSFARCQSRLREMQVGWLFLLTHVCGGCSSGLLPPHTSGISMARACCVVVPVESRTH